MREIPSLVPYLQFWLLTACKAEWPGFLTMCSVASFFFLWMCNFKCEMFCIAIIRAGTLCFGVQVFFPHLTFSLDFTDSLPSASACSFKSCTIYFWTIATIWLCSTQSSLLLLQLFLDPTDRSCLPIFYFTISGKFKPIYGRGNMCNTCLFEHCTLYSWMLFTGTTLIPGMINIAHLYCY